MASKETASAVQNRVIFLKRKTSQLLERVKQITSELMVDKIVSLTNSELEVHLTLIAETKSAFSTAHDTLEQLDFNEIGSKIRDEFDKLSVSVEVAIRHQIKKNSSDRPPSSTFRHDDTADRQIVMISNRQRAPEIKLPTFSGGYTEFADFSSMFTTLIDKDVDLTNVEKMQHLRSCLQGAALDTVRALEITAENYSVAMDLLSRRFSNKRLVFQAHISKILGLQRVSTTSASQLRQFSDKLNAHLRALQAMGSSQQIAECMIVYMLLQRVDDNTQSSWEGHVSIDAVPSLKDFTSFLETRCQRMESMENATATYAPGKQVGKSSKNSSNIRSSFVTTSLPKDNCSLCGSNAHLIYSCEAFVHLAPPLRLKEVKRLELCINCLRKGHQMRACKSGGCRSCGMKHHTLLHFNNSNPTVPAQISAPISQPTASSSSSNSLMAQGVNIGDVLLATAVILIKNRAGSFIPCRALLDSGSQVHLVTTAIAQKLQLKRTRSAVVVSGIGDSNFSSEGCSVELDIQSHMKDYRASISALVAPRITDRQPSHPIDVASWKIPQNICLADPEFFMPRSIDVLIGASLFFELFSIGQIKLATGLPVLQKTRLGWLVSGGGQQLCKRSLMAAKVQEDYDANLERTDELLKRFWEIESCGEEIEKTNQEDKDCEDHFKAQFCRLSSGEFCVKLPLQQDLNVLGESYSQAMRRFLNLEKRLDRNPHLKAQYSAFIKEYRDLKHMSLVAPESRTQCRYYLPHHCVVKEDSTTTKLRVVFDGSAVTSSGYSLNDILMTGPTIQPKLLHTLLRFRTFRIALTGDICKMYRCVRLADPDSYLQCILWRDSREEEVKVYRLNTVTYGTRPAAFLAIRCMHQLAEDGQLVFPMGSAILKRDFYVDDLMTGGESLQEVAEIMKQTTDLLATGNFHIRKWCSNEPQLLEGIPSQDKETLLKFHDGTDCTKALGLCWDPASDNFLFSVLPHNPSSNPTKRKMLSTVARFYDPLGLIGPVITKAKIFLQDLWKEKLHWDESLPTSLATAWHAFCNSLSVSDRFVFPRRCLLPDAEVELHGFCDASTHAYGACVYALSITSTGKEAFLLCSKSRVAPLKALTVPKLELCGAELLAKLLGEVATTAAFSGKAYCWSDSTTALSWIRSTPARFNIFVSNRVSSIQRLTAGMDWHYVPTKLNPADILSRGALPSELSQSRLWFHGPEFLLGSSDAWPSTPIASEPLEEVRKRVLLALCPFEDIAGQHKFANSFYKLQRMFGYIYKLLNRKRSNGLTVDDITGGTRILIRSVQHSKLWDDYKTISEHGRVPLSSSISSLHPFVDDFGVLRVGGRLRNSSLDFNARHPAILPRNHPITSAMITHYHRRNLHAGPQALLALIRQQYWPIGGRKTVAGIVNKCIRCFRARPRLLEHIMADLPKERVIEASHTFMITGVDFCGPFFYKSEVRTRPPIKCYICIFICFATKAVHLEVAQDLSTPAFINVLQRFISTRCRPKEIWSDNATNFVGASNELKQLKQLLLSDKHQQAVKEFCVADQIDWRFIPPRSPHFGGLWEAAVKTAKHHFYRAAANVVLGFDELRTLVCHIMAIINSRPLLVISEHPDDLDVLTPGHFLGAAPPSALPAPDVTRLNFNRLDRWQQIAFLQQTFWARWKEEYLSSLQERKRWKRNQPTISIGDVVLVKNENLPPLSWPGGKVTGLTQGSDGVARVAKLKTARGETARAVAKDEGC